MVSGCFQVSIEVRLLQASAETFAKKMKKSEMLLILRVYRITS